jgi:hypothetical protein
VAAVDHQEAQSVIRKNRWDAARRSNATIDRNGTRVTGTALRDFSCHKQAVTITIPQGAAPVIRLVLRVPDQDGELVTRDLSAVNAAQFIIKGSPDVPDPPPAYTTNGGGLTLLDPRVNGVVLVAFTSADTAIPGSTFWRLDLIMGSVGVLGGHGKLHVADV